jgi:hypothetical protein
MQGKTQRRNPVLYEIGYVGEHPRKQDNEQSRLYPSARPE